MKALLIIDMQIGSFRPYSARYNTYEIIENINLIANYFRKNEDMVIYIQHTGIKDNCFIPGTDDWKLLPELSLSTDDLFVNKTANDCFYQTDLHNLLNKNNIRDLTITGCATDFCVDSTIKSALTKDYKITVIKDGHTTASRPYVNAINLIKHYNWLWKETTATKYPIEIISTNKLIKDKN